MGRMENKKVDALAAVASTVTLPDQMQVTLFEKWIVPPPYEEEYIKNELDHMVAAAESSKQDWRQSIINYICYGILLENPRERITYVVMHHTSFTTRTYYIEIYLRVCFQPW